jgi:hypothetical protein
MQPSLARGARLYTSEGTPVQPDAEAVAPLALVPLVWIIDRERARAVEVGQLAARQIGGDMVDADRRLLVALARLLHAVLAKSDVVVGNQSRPTVVVGKHVQARAPRVHQQHMLLRRMQLQNKPWQAVFGRPLALRAQPHQRLVAHAVDLFLRHRLFHVAEGLQRPCARQQQVAAHQVSEAELGYSRISASTRVIASSRRLASIDSNTCESRSSGSRGSGDGTCDTKQHCKKRDAHQPLFSSRICHWPPDRTITSVLRLLDLSTSER